VLECLSAWIKQEGDSKLAQIASLLTSILTERRPRPNPEFEFSSMKSEVESLKA